MTEIFNFFNFGKKKKKKEEEEEEKRIIEASLKIKGGKGFLRRQHLPRTFKKFGHYFLPTDRHCGS